MDLRIDHLDCRYRTPASAEEASVVQKRLDLIAKSFLARVWDQGAGYDDNDSVYFAESVEVDLTLDAFVDDDNRLARTWARELHKGVTQTLQAGGRGVVIFRNRTEFLASFIGDLLRGGAWDKWYYREFASLASKSTAQAAAAVLAADPDAGRDVLILLTRRGDLDLLMAVLSDRDVELVVGRCLLPWSQRIVLPNSYARWTEVLRQLLSKHPPFFTNNVSRDLARLYLTVLVESSGLGPDVNLARFISELLQLRNTIIALKDSSGFLRLVALEEWDRAFAGLVDPGERRFAVELARELGGPPLTTLLRELQTASPVQTRKILTCYGGLFLLAPAAIKLGLETFLRDSPYPDPPGAAKSSLLLFLISLQCLGGKNAVKAAKDSALLLFTGLSAAPDKSYLARYAETLTDEMHESFQGLFRRHLTDVVRPGAGVPFVSEEVDDQPDWFSLDPADVSVKWAQALVPVSRALLRLFASSLGAFAESSPAYLSRNVLESHAEVEESEEQIGVRLLTCPLQMVLRMAGFDHARPMLPWLGNRELHFRFD